MQILALTLVGVCAFLLAVALLSRLLLGWVNINASPPSSQSGDEGLRGLSVILYATALFVNALTGDIVSLQTFYLVALLLFGVLIANMEYGKQGTSALSPETYMNPYESLFGILASGSLFLYFWIVQFEMPLVAVVAAYSVFIFVFSVYRSIVTTLGFSS